MSGVDKNNRKFTKYVKFNTKSITTIGPIVTDDKKILTEDKERTEELTSFLLSSSPRTFQTFQRQRKKK